MSYRDNRESGGGGDRGGYDRDSRGRYGEQAGSRGGYGGDGYDGNRPLHDPRDSRDGRGYSASDYDRGHTDSRSGHSGSYDRYQHEHGGSHRGYDSRGSYDEYSRGHAGHSSSRGFGDQYGSQSRYEDPGRSRGSHGSSSSDYYGGSSSYSSQSRGPYDQGYKEEYGGHGSSYDTRERGYGSRHESRGYDSRDDKSYERLRSDDRGYSRSYQDRTYEQGRSDHGKGSTGDRADHDRGYASTSDRSHHDRGYGGASDRTQQDRGYGGASDRTQQDRGYGGASDRTRQDRGYGGASDRTQQDRGYGGASDRTQQDRGYGGASDRTQQDRGYGGGSNRSQQDRGYGSNTDRSRDNIERLDGRSASSRSDSGSGAGDLKGSGYEAIGEELKDPRLVQQWNGSSSPMEYSPEDPALSQVFNIAVRPDYGSAGRSIKINANYFALSLNKAVTEIFKYHVNVERSPDSKYGPNEMKKEGQDVTLDKQEDVTMEDTSAPARREERPLPKKLMRLIINETIQQHKDVFMDSIRVVHDGMAALYAPMKLSFEVKTFKGINPDGPVVFDESKGGRPPKVFDVTMKLVEIISINDIKEFFKGGKTNPQRVIQALDVAARHLNAQRLVSVGRSFFSMKNPFAMKGGKELCWGHHQSIVAGQLRLLLNVNQSATVFYQPGPLMDLAIELLKVQDPSDVRNLDSRALRDLSRALSKLEITQKHRNDRKRKIQGISPLPASETIETIKGQEISIAKYFNDRYGALRFPNLPLVNIGSKKKPTWVPIELCEVVPGQRCQNINELDTAEIIKVANKKPNERMYGILDQIKAANFDNDPYMDAFGVTVESSMEELTARVLDTPEIQYSNVTERPKFGSWNLRDKKFVDPATVEKWGVVNAARVDRRTVENFIREFVKAAERCGMRFQDTRPVIVDVDRHSQVEESMRECVKEVEKRDRSRPVQLIMVIKQDAGTIQYGDIKRMSDTVLGIPSQCVVAKNIRRPRPDYCANVALKINMKLNGKNSIVRDIFPVVGSCPTIIIGADVSHPRSGMGSRPAIASVVASLDRYSAKYVARVGAQKAHNDKINSLPSMIRDLFLAYYRHTHRKPESIIYYRDGVSEGQFSDILNSEMIAIRTACKMMSDDYLPPVTFIIVNKRHHTRCFVKDQRDGDRSGNMLPGTVIDTKITGPNRYDFFLYGHSGIQGTSCPAHYTVLHDEHNMSPDDIQKLTYNLCYTFSRCTRSVSVVPPVYYAHLAAARARFFLNETSDGTSTIGSGSSNWSDFEFADLHENLRDIMFFI